MNKYKKLGLSLLFDAIGCLSYLFLGFGELTDIVWAPISAYIMTKMYKSQTGKIAGTISFIEEIMPGLDIIPTFTITWFYVYVFKSKTEETVIEVK